MDIPYIRCMVISSIPNNLETTIGTDIYQTQQEQNETTPGQTVIENSAKEPRKTQHYNHQKGLNLSSK
jgi:hypothetical protein